MTRTARLILVAALCFVSLFVFCPVAEAGCGLGLLPFGAAARSRRAARQQARGEARASAGVGCGRPGGILRVVLPPYGR